MSEIAALIVACIVTFVVTAGIAILFFHTLMYWTMEKKSIDSRTLGGWFWVGIVALIVIVGFVTAC